MKHIIIMPEDCYKATNGCIVRKSSMGVEIPAGFNEVKYIVSTFSPEAIKQAWLLHTCDIEISSEVSGGVLYKPKAQNFKMVEYEN